MPADVTTKPESRLTLQSRLDELERLWPWVEALVAEYSIPADTQFAIHLSLEEAVSNIIRHGYANAADQPITVECAFAPGTLAFLIEDRALAFNPLQASGADSRPAPASIDELPLGGRGIGLMKKFAGSLAYERLPGGNRLTIVFPLPR